MNRDQNTNVVVDDDMDIDDEPIVRKFSPRIAKRLKIRKGKVVESSRNLQIGSQKEFCCCSW